LQAETHGADHGLGGKLQAWRVTGPGKLTRVLKKQKTAGGGSSGRTDRKAKEHSETMKRWLAEREVDEPFHGLVGRKDTGGAGDANAEAPPL